MAADLQQRQGWPDNLLEKILPPLPDQGRLLLILDQFEELCTRCPEPDIKHRFVDTLLAMAREPVVNIILTIRADFINQVLTYRPMADTFQQSSLILGPMTAAELRQVIVEPARLRCYYVCGPGSAAYGAGRLSFNWVF